MNANIITLVAELADETTQFSLEDSESAKLNGEPATLVPISRLVVPAKRPCDQPLITYDLESDDEEDKKNSKRRTSSKRKVREHSPVADESSRRCPDFATSSRLTAIRPPTSWTCCHRWSRFPSDLNGSSASPIAAPQNVAYSNNFL
jgi:septal ring-binding cell division protein DamX